MDEAVLEAGLLEYPGRAVLNSLPMIPDRLEKGLPLARRHGAGFVALLMDASGVPEKASGRIRILEGILEQAHRAGLCASDIVVDPVVLVESASPGASSVTLEVIREVTTSYRLPTIIGLSNVSFGLPGRRAVNQAMLAQAIRAGLSAAILDPFDESIIQLASASEMLRRGGDGIRAYIDTARRDSPPAREEDGSRSGKPDLRSAIRSGSPEEAAAAASAELRVRTAADLIEEVLIPEAAGLGAAYEEGRMFLPQLIAGAEAIRAAFEAVRREASIPPRARIHLATVEGDVHDIGKNIVGAVLAGNGWDVVDLGRDVPARRIVESLLSDRPDAVGLSALLTPSLAAIRQAVEAIRNGVPEPPVIIVGGAVVSEEFASGLGVLYGRDAVSGARVLDEALAARQGKAGPP
jgi:5-methyltetrahydrofolate--homocysteine methyltransferase